MLSVRAKFLWIACVCFSLVILNWLQFVLTTLFLEYGGSVDSLLSHGLDDRLINLQAVNILFGVLFGLLCSFLMLREFRTRETLARETDVTEDANGQSLRDLKQLERTKSRVLHTITAQSHPPLHAIQANLALFTEGDLGKISPAQEKVLNATARQAKRLERTIADLGLFVAIEEQSLTLHWAPMNPIELLRGVLAEYQRDAKQKGIKCTTSLRRLTKDVDGDAERWKQVFHAVLENAIQYTPEGGTVSVKAEEGEGRILILVRDTGIGIPVADQKQLFTKYFRASNATEGYPDGTGIGLYVAKKLAEAHGGTIEIASRIGSGTTVMIAIPRRTD